MCFTFKKSCLMHILLINIRFTVNSIATHAYLTHIHFLCKAPFCVKNSRQHFKYYGWAILNSGINNKNTQTSNTWQNDTDYSVRTEIRMQSVTLLAHSWETQVFGCSGMSAHGHKGTILILGKQIFNFST